ncbi:phasin family protein [Chroococcidiopsis sp. CCNUC1]|nr:phasin family protein [Chroococcidiopsis sp. CCNUC1]URD49108.1 phasin family protein [Chroococcidiopsis sp. CCNUC1]
MGAIAAMPGLGDIVQKAFYLGVGLASYASEKATGKLAELRSQAQKLADELVAKGEMTADEAKRYVDDLMRQAQQPPTEVDESKASSEPRRIEILSDDEENPTTPTTQTAGDDNVDRLREQVQKLQDELRRLQRE